MLPMLHFKLLLIVVFTLISLFMVNVIKPIFILFCIFKLIDICFILHRCRELLHIIFVFELSIIECKILPIILCQWLCCSCYFLFRIILIIFNFIFSSSITQKWSEVNFGQFVVYTPRHTICLGMELFALRLKVENGI